MCIPSLSLSLTLSHFLPLPLTPNTNLLINMEILQEFSASNDHMIIKGKRTKRPRSSSSANSSPTTSSGISANTEEDEDLANCLILLARGRLAPHTETTSRKHVDVGTFLYECKTCTRTFPSFQALGGHRASHKRPKSAADSDQNKEEVVVEVDEHPPKFSNLNTTIAPPPSTPTHAAKIHECSICGSEFASGQALGGHMRRHRSGPNTTAAVGRSRSDDDHSSTHDRHVVVIAEKTRSMLTLDLNLPAPAEAETRGFSSNQQPRIIFPAAALVDCHY